MDVKDIGNNTGNSGAFCDQQAMSTAPVISNDIMIRRAKNRDRQRRYRARKRLELEIKRSCLLGQPALMQSDSSMAHSNLNPAFLVPTEATVMVHTSVYSGRKWKKDAREAHSRKETENLVRVAVMFVKSPSEAEYSIGGHMKAVARRDWKADARNNNSMETSENE